MKMALKAAGIYIYYKKKASKQTQILMSISLKLEQEIQYSVKKYTIS